MTDIEPENMGRAYLEKLDEQHGEIADYLLLLKGCTNNLFKRSSAIDILEEMIACMALHMKKEEDLLTECKFPDLDSHKKDHIDLLASMNAFKDDFTKRCDLITHFDILRIMKWIEDHLLGPDTQYRNFLLNCYAA